MNQFTSGPTPSNYRLKTHRFLSRFSAECQRGSQLQYLWYRTLPTISDIFLPNLAKRRVYKTTSIARAKALK
jgi:hypothetical protein